MKKFLLTFIAVIVVVGALAGVGFAGYRMGYAQGAGASGDAPFFDRFERMHPNFVPMPGNRNFGPGGYDLFYRHPMMGRGLFGINFFSPLRILWNIAILALIVWFVFWLFTKSGWRIVRQNSTEPTASSEKTEG
jgi:uncharacterized membrane protein